MDLPTSAYVVLGMLRLGARSGYDVQKAVEISTRHFWTISPAQVYPALKRLEKEGLAEGRSDPRGRRRRRVYAITPPGEEALRDWLRADEPLALEMRDLAMVKLFFADALDDEEVRAHVGAMRARSEQTLERMQRDSEPVAAALEREGVRFPHATLRLGMAIQRAMAEFLGDVEGQIAGAGEHRSLRSGRSSPRRSEAKDTAPTSSGSQKRITR